MIKNNNNSTKYSYKDLVIEPAVKSNISSRSQISLSKRLPIYTAPMSGVINLRNYQIFESSMNPIVPRNIALEQRFCAAKKGYRIALGLHEIDKFVSKDIRDYIRSGTNHVKICIDIANGHMVKDITKMALKIKKKYGDYRGRKTTIMIGNIANPETYREYCEFNKFGGKSVIDEIRVGIGTGGACLTSSNTGIHYPIASLIEECYNIKQEYVAYRPKIIADGGMTNYDDIIKAYALGADFVMLGKLLFQTFESAAKLTYPDISQSELVEHIRQEYHSLQIRVDADSEEAKKQFMSKYPNGHKEYYGMASKTAQKEYSNVEKTSEGIEMKLIPMNYTLNQWVDNLRDYLKSAMSYCGKGNLKEFKGKVQLIPIIQRYYNP